MKSTDWKITNLLVALGFILSAFAVFAPAGAAAGRAGNFVVSIEFTDVDGNHDNNSAANAQVNITVNASLAASVENMTDLNLMVAVNDVQLGTTQSLGELDQGMFEDYTWQWTPAIYGDYKITATAMNDSDTANQTVTTQYYQVQGSNITVSSVSVTPDSALIGVDQVTITAVVMNSGNMAASGNLSFMLDGTKSLGYINQAVNAGGDANFVLTTKFENMTIANGVHNVSVSMMDLEMSGAVSNNFNLTNPVTNVTIAKLTADKTSGYEGDVVTFTASLSNSGNMDATNVTIYFDDMVLGILPSSIGKLTGLTVLKAATGVNFTWAYTLPNITLPQEIKTIRAGYGEGFFLTSVQTINITVMKRLPTIQFVSFVVPAGIRQYDDVMVNITVKNTGTVNATGMIIKITEGGGTLNTTDPFNLSAGASKTVSMYISIMDSGDMNQTFTATATAAGVDYTNSTTVYVLHQIYASIGIQAFKVSPGTKDNQPKDSSQSYTATITLKNSGEKAGKVQLMLLDNLKIVANQSASVDAGASKDVKVTFSIKGSGTHTIRAVVTGDIDYANMTKTAKCTLNYQPGFEVVVLVAAVLVAAVLVRRRKD
jgi:hypothetical protein